MCKMQYTRPAQPHLQVIWAQPKRSIKVKPPGPRLSDSDLALQSCLLFWHTLSSNCQTFFVKSKIENLIQLSLTGVELRVHTDTTIE